MIVSIILLILINHILELYIIRMWLWVWLQKDYVIKLQDIMIIIALHNINNTKQGPDKLTPTALIGCEVTVVIQGWFIRATVDNLNTHVYRLFRPIGSHQHSVSQVHNISDMFCNNYYENIVPQEVLLINTTELDFCHKQL